LSFGARDLTRSDGAERMEKRSSTAIGVVQGDPLCCEVLTGNYAGAAG